MLSRMNGAVKPISSVNTSSNAESRHHSSNSSLGKLTFPCVEPGVIRDAVKEVSLDNIAIGVRDDSDEFQEESVVDD